MEDPQGVESCRQCSKRPETAELVTLWDGNSYCRQCIETASPALLPYARKHSSLVDEIPWNAKEQIHAIVRLYLIIVACFAVLLLPLLVSDHAAEYAVAVLVMAFCGAIACAIQGPMFFWMGMRTLPSVGLKNGILTVNTPCVSRRCQIPESPLAQWAWYEGKVKHDSLYRGLARRGQKAIVLVYQPPGAGWRLFHAKVTCGLTPERYEIWRALLQLSGARPFGGDLRSYFWFRRECTRGRLA